MKIAIISASHRKNSRSRQIANWIAKHAEGNEMQTQIFDLSEMEIPFWTESFWNPESGETKSWKPMSESLGECQATVVIAPEWAGMIPPKLTNFLLLCSKGELAYKPTLLVGISAGTSGTYPIAQLRMSAGKNNQMFFLPDHLIIRNVGEFFNNPENEKRMEDRLVFNLKILRPMAICMKDLRLNIDLKRYPYGM